MYRNLCGLVLLLTSCAHTAPDDAFAKSASERLAGQAFALEQLKAEQQALAASLKALSDQQAELNKVVIGLSKSVEELKGPKPAAPAPTPDADTIYKVSVADAAARGPACRLSLPLTPAFSRALTPGSPICVTHVQSLSSPFVVQRRVVSFGEA